MGVASSTVNDVMVFSETAYPHRWLDAFGADVAKTIYTFDGDLPLTAADAPLGWTVTLVEAGASDSTITMSNVQGGAMVITTDAADNDGVNMQLSNEPFKLSGSKPLYFGIKFQSDEATQDDFLVGLCITDTTLLGGVSDGIYFRKVDASTAVNFVMEKNSTESTIGVDTFAASTDVVYEFYYDGTYVTAYVDGSQVAKVTVASESNLPDDEELAPSIHFLTGEASSHTMTVDWLRVIQAN